MPNNSEDRLEEKICAKCDKEFDKDKIIGCDGNCNKWFHIKCVGIKDKDFAVIDACVGVKWYCNVCTLIPLQDVKDLIKDAMNKYIDEIKDLKNLVTKLVNKNEVEQTSLSKKLFSEVTNKPSIIIKPKVDQKSTKTRDDLKQNISPTQLAVGIMGINNVKNGGIAIRCEKQEDVKKLEGEVSKKLGAKYEVSLSTLKNPLFKLVGLHDNMTETEIIKYLRSQNENISDSTLLIVKKIYERSHKYNAILETDGETFHKIIRNGKLNVGWQRCPVYEEYNVLRCFKCNGYNHKINECKNKEACPKCAGEHKFHDCNSRVYKCVNCIYANNKFNLKFDTCHSALDLKCPVYCKKIEIQKNRTKYI